MMDRVSSFRKTVCGDGSSGSSHSDTWYDVFSKRFAGLLAAPRPRFSVLTPVFSHGFVRYNPHHDVRGGRGSSGATGTGFSSARLGAGNEWKFQRCHRTRTTTACHYSEFGG